MIDRYISRNVIAGISDPRAAQEAVRRWSDGLFSHAAVRISLAEQWAAGRGCCRRPGAPDPNQADQMKSGCCAKGYGVTTGARESKTLTPENKKAQSRLASPAEVKSTGKIR